MSERTLKQLVGALAIVVGIGLVSSLFSGGTGSIGASGAITRVFEGVTPDAVESVEVTRSGEAITLARAGDGWTAGGHPADPDMVARFLDQLSRSTVGDLVATNPSNHARMGVTVDSAIALRFTVAGSERRILVGRSGQRFGTAYARLQDEDEVYLLESDIRGQIARDLDGWRNRTMVALDTASIARIEVVRADERYALVRGDSAWTFDGGGEVRTSAMSGILAELSSLVAAGFLQPTDSLAALPLASTTRAWDASDRLLAEITVGAGESEHWARNGVDEYVYRMSSFRARRLAPGRADAAPAS